MNLDISIIGLQNKSEIPSIPRKFMIPEAAIDLECWNSGIMECCERFFTHYSSVPFLQYSINPWNWLRRSHLPLTLPWEPGFIKSHKILLSEKHERINHFLTRGLYLSPVVGMPDWFGGRFFDAAKNRSGHRLTIRFCIPPASSSRYVLSALCIGKKAPIKSLDFPSSLMT